MNVPNHVPQEQVVDFDFYALDRDNDDLFQAWKQLHDGPDIFWTPRNGGHWVVTRADDIEEIFKNYECFTSSKGDSLPIPEKFQFPPVDYDPPMHGKFRNIMAPYFTPKAVGDLERRARQLSIELIEGFYARGECEFYGDFSLHMPIGIFLSLVDLPESDRLYLLDLASVMTRSHDLEEKKRAFTAVWAYLEGKFAEREKAPGKDMISALTQAVVDGRKLTREEKLGFGSVALGGGLDTVASTLGFVARFLADHPDYRRQLIDNPELIQPAVEEFLRRFAVADISRVVAKDVEFHGVRMNANDPILIPSTLANLDERRFPDPMRVDFQRSNTFQHLTFGTGPHRCIGSYLARVELKVFLEEWLKRIPDFTITPGKRPLARGGSVMAMIELPLSWTVRDAK